MSVNRRKKELNEAAWEQLWDTPGCRAVALWRNWDLGEMNLAVQSRLNGRGGRLSAIKSVIYLLHPFCDSDCWRHQVCPMDAPQFRCHLPLWSHLVPFCSSLLTSFLLVRPFKCSFYSGPLQFSSSTWKSFLSTSTLIWLLLFLWVSDQIILPERVLSWPP